MSVGSARLPRDSKMRVSSGKVAKLPPGIDFIQGLKSFDGSWTRTDGRYVLGTELQGSKQSVDALVNETGRLTWTFGSGNQKFTVFFVRTS